MTHDSRMPVSDFDELAKLAEALAPDGAGADGILSQSLGPAAKLVNEVRQVLSEPAREDDFASRTNEAWARVKASGVLEVPGSSKRSGGFSARALPRGVGYAAAAVVLMAGLVIPLSNFQKKGRTNHVLSYKTYTTHAGQRASLSLRDGSRIILGPASTLRVYNGEASGTAVEVTGEALFNVNHSPTQPFEVTTYGMITRVLGTEFVVRAYNPSYIRIAVRDGKVSVKRQITSASSIVTAGEVAVAVPNRPPKVESISDLATEFAWANGELVLNDVPVDLAFERLSRWYGLEFRADGKTLLEAHVNATFPATFNATDMQSLADAIGARLVQSGKVLTFRSR